MTTYRVTEVSGGEVAPGGEFTLEASQQEMLEELMIHPTPDTQVCFRNPSGSITGTAMSVARWATLFSTPREDDIRHISYRPINETDAYLFLYNHLGINLRDHLGRVAGRITQMTLDLQEGALPVLRATFSLGAHDPVGPVMNHLLGLREGPLRLSDYTLSMAVDMVATLEAEFIVDNRFGCASIPFKPETTYAPEPAPEQLPEARGPETRFREWSSSLKGSQRERQVNPA